MNGSRNRVAVLGAGGRAGRAIVREAADRGLPVVAVVRDPRRHADLATNDINVVEGDALDASSLIAIIDPSVSAIVSTVTPFTFPPRDFSTLDPQFFSRAATAITTVADDRRIIIVGLFATLRSASGDVIMDDADVFPPALRPFAESHYRGVEALRRTDSRIDWLELAPPPELSEGEAASSPPVLGSEIAEPTRWGRVFSYADLARAALNEIVTPTRHRELVAVTSADASSSRR